MSLFRKSRNIQAIIGNVFRQKFIQYFLFCFGRTRFQTLYRMSRERVDMPTTTFNFFCMPFIYSSHFIKVYYYYPMPFSPLSSLMGTFINDDKIAFLQSVHFFIFHSFQALKMDFISLPVVR